MSAKVLLVDDEAEYLSLLAERMESRGMEVSACTSAAEAMEMIEGRAFDAVVLDLVMPGIDGLQALKLIKQRHPEIHVILLTGHASVRNGVEAMKLGASEFLEKTADIAALTDKIERAQAQKFILMERKTEHKTGSS